MQKVAKFATILPLFIKNLFLLLALLAAVEAARAHHVAHVCSHYGLHHLTGAFELLE